MTNLIGMERVLSIFILVPFFGFFISLFIGKKQEVIISWCMSLSAGIQVIVALVFTVWWGLSGHEVITLEEFVLYASEDYQFFLAFHFDHITAVYLILSGLLTFLISRFSRIYLHKDPGYKRYYNTMLLYYLGIQLIIFSGNFETLLIGWEILGLSSFLLIAYFRSRYLPVRNAFKVFSIYRLADIGILLSMWLLHHLFNENITFHQLNDPDFVRPFVHEHFWTIMIISSFIFLAASVKSAQFPFSSWLPRAMEGPTPSSSIFYGSIAVHIGVYLLLRTYPLWSEILAARVWLIVIGLASALITSSIAKVQFSIKAQIAWSSMSQIGLMFVEVALGLETLVLIHLCGNAFLRSYQLLNSPSVATYTLRDQFFNLVVHDAKKRGLFRKKLKKTLYVLALNEYYMDNFLYRFIWNPFKIMGRRLAFLGSNAGLITVIVLLIGSFVLHVFPDTKKFGPTNYLPLVFASIGLMLVLRAFTNRKSPFRAWLMLLMSHLWIAMAVYFNEDFSNREIFYYLLGVVMASGIGFVLLRVLAKKEKFDLNDYYGHATDHNWLALGFLLCSLALMGFPISTTFLGEHLMISHIREDQVVLMIIVAINIMLSGISTMRIYTRIFMGPNHKWNRSQANKFS